MTSKQTSKRESKIEPEIMDFVGLDGPGILENHACYQGALLGPFSFRPPLGGCRPPDPPPYSGPRAVLLLCDANRSS